GNGQRDRGEIDRGDRCGARGAQRGVVVKAAYWAISARYAAPGLGRRRHPAPEDFCRRTIVGPAGVASIEAIFDLLEIPEDTRVKIRAKDVVRDFVDGKLVPDQPYPHHALGMHYVSSDPDAQLVEWDMTFAIVTRFIETGTGGPL